MATNLIDSIISITSNPQRVLPGLFEYGFAWLVTRRLSSLLILSPVLLVFVLMLGFALAGEWQNELQLAKLYLERAEDEASDVIAVLDDQEATSDNTAEDFFQEQELTPDAELYLRRTLQLTSSNNRATFLVALQLANEKRLGQARELMRRAAPENATGYPPAHAWLAIDRLNLGQITAEEKEALLNDLEVARTWPRVGWNLVAAYAKLLENDRRVGDAIRVLEQSGDNAMLQIQLADLARRTNRTKTLQDVSQKVIERAEENLASDEIDQEELRRLATIYLFNQEADKAIEVANRGLGREPDDTQLTRIKSEAYRVKYLRSIQQTFEGAQVDLALLNAAMVTDPSNPAVAQEVARLTAGGVGVSKELMADLQEKLRDGEATALTHVLVAEKYLVDGNLSKAVVHLEVANEQAPNAPDVLNNLALALARTDRNQRGRALEMATKAVELTRRQNPNFLDTKGEIHSRLGDFPAAIACYEAAIALSPNNTDVRERLAKTYRHVGMDDMAKAQEEKVREIERGLKQSESTTGSPASSTDAAAEGAK